MVNTRGSYLTRALSLWTVSIRMSSAVRRRERQVAASRRASAKRAWRSATQVFEVARWSDLCFEATSDAHFAQATRRRAPRRDLGRRLDGARRRRRRVGRERGRARRRGGAGAPRRGRARHPRAPPAPADRAPTPRPPRALPPRRSPNAARPAAPPSPPLSRPPLP